MHKLQCKWFIFDKRKITAWANVRRFTRNYLVPPWNPPYITEHSIAMRVSLKSPVHHRTLYRIEVSPDTPVHHRALYQIEGPPETPRISQSILLHWESPWNPPLITKLSIALGGLTPRTSTRRVVFPVKVLFPARHVKAANAPRRHGRPSTILFWIRPSSSSTILYRGL